MRGATPPPDLVLQNARLVNVLTGEIYHTDIAIKRSRVAAVGSGYHAEAVIDLGGRYACPGLIDAHVHIESSLCTPPAFAQAVLAHGVTSVITDPHEIANVLGLEGIHYMLQEAKYGNLSMYVMASSCVPATHMQTAGASLEYDDLEGLLNNRWVLGLAEMMNYPGVIEANHDVLDKIGLYDGQVMDGHAPGLTGKALNAYIAAGIRSGPRVHHPGGNAREATPGHDDLHSRGDRRAQRARAPARRDARKRRPRVLLHRRLPPH
ncbi:MAG: amidohydrolase family protein [Anaerolineae bacterium]|nr:amidohydrolase family protein [Anaerolineae bacterium]